MHNRARSIDICGVRLANQHLTNQTLATAADVVSALGAVQAQDYSGAKWGIAQRGTAIADTDVEAAISSARILRTHVLRPTWHFVAAADIRWLLALTSARIRASAAHYDRKLGIDEDVRRRSRNILSNALRERTHLTRSELGEALAKGGVRADGTQRLAHLMIHAELDGLVCSGARRGKQFTYALLDECVPTTKPLERDAALNALAGRYFSTRGPATENDFAWWSGLTKADARAAVRSVDSLESEVIDGRTYWFPPMRRPPRKMVVRLLPAYDEYMVSYADRSASHKKVSPAQVGEKFDFLGQYVITVNGQVVGRWNRSVDKRGVGVSLALLTKVSRDEHTAIERETGRFARFLQLPLRVETTKAKAVIRSL